MQTHIDIIICPECNTEQPAKVEQTFPWWTYVHYCENCSYLIMESEWNRPKRDVEIFVDKNHNYIHHK